MIKRFSPAKYQEIDGFQGGHRNGFEVMMVFEFRIHVFLPVTLVHDEVEAVVLVLGHVLHEQAPRNFATHDDILIHAEDVAAQWPRAGSKAAGPITADPKPASFHEPLGVLLDHLLSLWHRWCRRGC